MKKLLTLSFLVTKLTALYCFSAMGLIVWDIVEAKSPCHENTEIAAQTTENLEEDCNACVIAADSWDQELVASADVELTEIMAVVPTTLEFDLVIKSLEVGTYTAYHPPPQVLYKTASNLFQRSIVLLS